MEPSHCLRESGDQGALQKEGQDGGLDLGGLKYFLLLLLLS